jgi:hypothetical protein
MSMGNRMGGRRLGAGHAARNLALMAGLGISLLGRAALALGGKGRSIQPRCRRARRALVPERIRTVI